MPNTALPAFLGEVVIMLWLLIRGAGPKVLAGPGLAAASN